MKQNAYRVYYGTGKRNAQLKIDEIFAEKVMPLDDSVRLLDEIMEEMDETPLMRAYKRTGRRIALLLMPLLPSPFLKYFL